MCLLSINVLMLITDYPCFIRLEDYLHLPTFIFLLPISLFSIFLSLTLFLASLSLSILVSFSFSDYSNSPFTSPWHLSFLSSPSHSPSLFSFSRCLLLSLLDTPQTAELLSTTHSFNCLLLPLPLLLTSLLHYNCCICSYHYC